jgi:hypothetical protein
MVAVDAVNIEGLACHNASMRCIFEGGESCQSAGAGTDKAPAGNRTAQSTWIDCSAAEVIERRPDFWYWHFCDMLSGAARVDRKWSDHDQTGAIDANRSN